MKQVFRFGVKQEQVWLPERNHELILMTLWYFYWIWKVELQFEQMFLEAYAWPVYVK